MGQLSLQVIEAKHSVVQTSQRTLSGRASVILHYRGEQGDSLSEATPLPGFGDDDLQVAERQLGELTVDEFEGVVAQVTGAFDVDARGLLGNSDAPVGVLSRWSERFQSRSARFCAEILVLASAARVCGVPMWRLLSSDRVADTLPTSSVVDPSAPDWEERLDAQLQLGVRTFKVKCGRASERELSVVRALSGHALPLRYRLDPNGAWTIDEAIQFLNSIDRERLDWVEDPTADVQQWGKIQQLAPVGLDEPLVTMDSEQIARLHPDLLIVKPMALGSIATCLRLTELAHQLQSQVSLSHFFDGPLAMSAYTHLAFALQGAGYAPGLGRHQALEGYSELGFPVPDLGDAQLKCPG